MSKSSEDRNAAINHSHGKVRKKANATRSFIPLPRPLAASREGWRNCRAPITGVLVPIEIGMIIALGKAFGISMTESAARSTILTTGATIAGRTISQILLGWIPGISNAVNAATVAEVVETLGWALADDFDKERRG